MSTLKRHLPKVSRALLGLIFAVNGLNGFLNFIPMPPPEGAAAAFTGGLAASGYFFPMLKAVELAAGALLLAGVLVPFALTLLAPIIVNIAAFHLFLAPAGMGIVALILVTELHLAWVHRAAFAPMFRRAAQPGEAPADAGRPVLRAAA
jgi:uncharacterized membrane protein YphA (DoxX/SURF4 family)